MSRKHRAITQTLVLSCAAILLFAASPALAEAPPAPENVIVSPMGHEALQISWSPGSCCSDPVAYYVYRNGKLITPGGIPEPQTFYDDIGLAPLTPHTYTVQAENTLTGELSPMSAHAAQMTMDGQTIRVPQDAATIQEAVMYAGPGTMIYLSPGIYEIFDPVMLSGRSGITLRGQDPEGVILEMYGTTLDLDSTPGTNVTLAGVTVVNGGVTTGEGDTVVNCVFAGGPMEAVSGGGFVTNSVFDVNMMDIVVPPGEYMMVANSIFVSGGGIGFSEYPPNGFLLNNNLVGGAPPDVPGESEGNYSAWPCFDSPSIPPPFPITGPDYPSYVTCPGGPDTNAGAFVGILVPDTMPDVGAFELSEPYTPEPASDLTVTFDEAQGGMVLRWTLSPNDMHSEFPDPTPGPIMEYLVYRSDFPDMAYAIEVFAGAEGTDTYVDYGTYPGGPPVYYQVRASLGTGTTYVPWPVVSMPSNTATTDAPTNVRATTVTDTMVEIAWDPPISLPYPTFYHVYRNGRQITPGPIPDTFFYDSGLAPDTPHTYTVQVVPACYDPPVCTPPPPDENITSAMSEHLGVKTEAYSVIRVPQDYPTIQAAVDAVPSATSIHVGPGLYQENLYLGTTSQVSIIGQDPQGVILDLTMGGNIDLGTTPGTGNTIGGFTIVGGEVIMGEGDTVSSCVFRDSPSSFINGGGFVTNSVFDSINNPPTPRPIVVAPMEFMAIANSVFIGPGPYLDLQDFDDPLSTITLFHNSFETTDPYGQFDWAQLPGKGNFQDSPQFRPPGPPGTYIIDWGLGVDSGIAVGLFVPDLMPDVGAFEFGVPYTPEPPTNLTAAWNSETMAVDLRWTASPDDWVVNPGTMNPIVDYRIYRSETPDFLPPNDNPIGIVPAGETIFQDFSALPGITYNYQVRANGGYVPPWGEVLSLPSNTASSETNTPPVAVDDSYSVNEDDTLIVVPPGVLLNDTDPEGDDLTAVLVSDVTNGWLTLNLLGGFDYTPSPGFSGTDTFTYVANDGVADSNVATVTIAVNRLIDRIHIESITMNTLTSKSQTHATATVVVVDEVGVASPGALVEGTWSGLTSDSDSGTTDALGSTTFDSDYLKRPSGDFCFQVDNVTLSGYTLDTGVGTLSACITYPPPPEICDDQVDNDRDGLVDCEDEECGGTPACGGSCDGYAEKETCQADSNCEWVGKGRKGSCQDAVSCTATEDPAELTCDDGIDNDCDGYIDLPDPDCGGCTPDGKEKGGRCSDGIDNDCDNLIDGADPDCG